MEPGDVVKYLKSMSISILMMLLLTYGMATKNPLLQPTWIIIIVIGAQMGYQMIKSARSRSVLEANMLEATRARKGAALFEASDDDVNKAKKGSIDEMSMSTKMIIMMIVPLVIFIGSGYVLSMLIPEIEQWQSYMIGFLLSMAVSMIISFKVKIVPGSMAATPNSYIINDKGIAFNHMNQSFILRFPLIKIDSHREKNFIEVEGKPEAQVIPNKLRLFTHKIDQLEKVLTKRVVSQDIHKG